MSVVVEIFTDRRVYRSTYCIVGDDCYTYEHSRGKTPVLTHGENVCVVYKGEVLGQVPDALRSWLESQYTLSSQLLED